MRYVFSALLVTAIAACTPSAAGANGPASQPASASTDRSAFDAVPQAQAGESVATFAGGCFWCLETAFEGFAGVKSVTSGYIGGHVKNPTYEQVSSRTTGHAEAVQIVFDPKVTSYEKLLDQFWVNIDPTTKDQQFCDRGDEYRSEIFAHGAAQKKAAQASKDKVLQSKQFKVVHTAVSDAGVFYPAERYHQDFYKKRPGHYQRYRRGCGRDARLKELWGERALGHRAH